MLGTSVGERLGLSVGATEGELDGLAVGKGEGAGDGGLVGDCVGTGAIVGLAEGASEGQLLQATGHSAFTTDPFTVSSHQLAWWVASRSGFCVIQAHVLVIVSPRYRKVPNVYVDESVHEDTIAVCIATSARKIALLLLIITMFILNVCEETN